MKTEEQILNAETALAGAILLDARCLERVPANLRESDFLSPLCRSVYAAARVLQREKIEIDPVTVGKWCKEHGFPLTVQQAKELMDLTPTAEGAQEYAIEIHESALRRAAAEVVDNVAEAVKSGAQPLLDCLSSAIGQLNNISTHTDSRDIVSLDDVSYEEPRWLIRPYFQRGKGTLIQADPGTGKTAFMCAVASAVSTGRGFLDLKVETPGNVLMVSNEDDAGVLRGRIEACGGNPKRIFLMKNSTGITVDSQELRSAIHRLRAKLLILDPLQAFLGPKVDMFRANETRPVMDRLLEMCSELDCACAIIAHLGKAVQGKSAVNQSLGSVDIPGVMRSILHIVRNPEMKEEIFAFHVKSSNAAPGKTIAYTIGDRGGVTFTGYTDLELRDLARTKSEEDYDFGRDPLAEVLMKLYEERGDGFFSYEDISTKAREILGTLPFDTSRELRCKLSRPQFRQSLLRDMNIQMELNVRRSNVRGIRLLHYHQPDGYQTQIKEPPQTPAMTVMTDMTVLPVKTQQEPFRHDTFYSPEEIGVLPWDE